MATLRETVVVGNVFNFPIMNPNNDRVLGVFAIAFPLVVFLDTLFEKKEQMEEDGEEEALKPPPRPQYPGGTPLLPYRPPTNFNLQRPPYPQTTPYVNPYQLTYSGRPRNPVPARYTASPGYANLMQNPQDFSNSGYKSQRLKHSGSENFKTHFEDNTHGRRPPGNGVPYTHYQLHNHRRADYVEPTPNRRQTQSGVRTAERLKNGPASASQSQRSPVYSGPHGRNDKTKRIRRDVENASTKDKSDNTKEFVDGYPNHSYLPSQRKIELGGSRSISEDQASVYTQFANMMSTAGVDGSSCLQYIICELALRDAARAEDLYAGPKKEENGGALDADPETSTYPKKVSDGGSKKKKKKSKKSKSSLMADIVATLLLPKQSQPLAQYVEAADTAIGAACGERYPGCPLGLSTVLNTILGSP